MKAVLVSFLMLLPAALFATTDTIQTAGFAFSPAVDTVTTADTINFILGSTIHNAVEVAQSTWNADGITPLAGGFSVPFGGGKVANLPLGTHYYVCQNHASLGMKGILVVVSAAPPPPPALNSLTVRKFVDQDGDFNTMGDQILKSWNLSLYHDSVSVSTLIKSENSSSFTVDSLPAGTYIATEADSAGWSHLTVNVDGFSQGSVTSGQYTIVITGSTESHVIDFVNYAPHTIININFSFSPDSLVVLQGSTVHFVLETMHDAREVSAATWAADDTVSNGGFEVPFGGGDIILSDTGTHYYVCIVHASIGMKGRIIVKPVGSTITLSTFYNSDWNLVSLPLQPNDNTVSVLYPSAVSKAFSYEGSYVPNTTVAPGLGYWLKFPDTATVTLTGLSIVGDSMAVARGWNMIGSISSPLPMASVSSAPPGIISSLLYGYNGSYFPTDTIEPGFGYWLRVDQAGNLIVGSNSNVPLASDFTKQVQRNAACLTLTDAAGHQRTLYMVDNRERVPRLEQFRPLPPPPPAGIFDVRFGSGGQIETIVPSDHRTYPIELSSVAYPLTIRWAGQALRRQIALLVDGVRIGLDGFAPIVLDVPVHTIALAQSSGSPGAAGYRLDPAFPNPCNPSTIVRYALPAESRVALRVYNLLGQLIATLADGVEGAGEKSIVWTTAGNGSGVYFVKLEAVPTAGGAPFSRVVKVLVQK